jgi:hypothetical protein
MSVAKLGARPSGAKRGGRPASKVYKVAASE